MRQARAMRRHQAGMTLISWMLIFVVAGILIMAALKLFPVYMEHISLTSSLNSLSSDHSLRGASPVELRNALMRRLDINDVKRVKSEDVTIQRDGAVYRVDVNYEVVVPFVYNISFLVSFEDTAEVAAR
jgi:Tfp pilus assembly protein FimT